MQPARYDKSRRVDLIYAYRVPRKRRKPIPKQAGFSLLELIVVLAGLGILASLAIPNFIKYLQFAQIDEAKSLLNASASECLQELRRSSDDSWKDFQPEALKARKSSTEGGPPALPGNYQYQDGKNTCEEVQIYDPAGGDTIFPMLRFRIDASGRVFKDSQYFNDESKKDCESWGNCGGSESADYLIQCKADQTACESNYSKFVSTQRDGGPWPVGKWQGTCKWPKDPQASCATSQVWTFEGAAVSSQADYDKKFEARFGKQCADAQRAAIANFNPPGQGIVNLPECNVYERYYKGNQLECANEQDCTTAYLAASEKERQQLCLAAEGAWKDKGENGKFSEPGCEVKWQCNGEIMTSQSDYEASACKKSPPAPSCGDPPASGCTKSKFYTHPVCATWSKCMGYI
jgi:prepilin-type N-terminal cleavage/methylation domain-containing protein